MLAYRVAPTLAAMLQEQQQGLWHPARGTGDSVDAVPLQCGAVPAHPALLSCRPLALQLLTGVAMVAWPVALAWATERRLRRQHAALCAACRGGAGAGGRQQRDQDQVGGQLGVGSHRQLTRPQLQVQKGGADARPPVSAAEPAGLQPLPSPFDVATMPSPFPTQAAAAGSWPVGNSCSGYSESCGTCATLPLSWCTGPGTSCASMLGEASAAIRAPPAPYVAMTTLTVTSVKVGRTREFGLR